MVKFIPNRKYIYSPENFVDQTVKALPKISGLRTCCLSRKLGCEMDWEGLLYLVLLF